MTTLQRIFAILTSVGVCAFILDLVRRRRLKEEYAWLWIVTSAGMFVLASWYGLLEAITHAIGAVWPTTALFLFALIFLLIISVHFSIVISRLTQQVRRLTQELAILQADRGGDAGAQGPQALTR